MPGLFPAAACLRPFMGACMAILLYTLPITSAQAALALNNTRLVFHSDKRNTTVVVRNPSTQTYAVQTWINTSADDNTTAVPFLPAPQLFKLPPGKEQLVQINGLPRTLPDDRESLFFLNVQEIPEASDAPGNTLNIAMRTRIKMFYRPQQLKDSSTSQLKSLKFSLIEKNGKPYLRVDNPSPFHVTFIRLNVHGPGQQHKLRNTAMVAPFAAQDYPVDGITRTAGLRAEFSVINDYGGYTTPLTSPIHLPN